MSIGGRFHSVRALILGSLRQSGKARTFGGRLDDDPVTKVQLFLLADKFDLFSMNKNISLGQTLTTRKLSFFGPISSVLIPSISWLIIKISIMVTNTFFATE